MPDRKHDHTFPEELQRAGDAAFNGGPVTGTFRLLWDAATTIRALREENERLKSRAPSMEKMRTLISGNQGF